MVSYKSNHWILSENNEASSRAYLPTKLGSAFLVKTVISHPALTILFTLTAQLTPVGIHLALISSSRDQNLKPV